MQNSSSQMSNNSEYTVNSNKTFSRCYHECPYFTLDGGPGPVMMCLHPEVISPYIISHPDCDDGFPIDCPLISNEEKIRKQLLSEDSKREQLFEKIEKFLCSIPDNESREFLRLAILKIDDYFNQRYLMLKNSIISKIPTEIKYKEKK